MNLEKLKPWNWFKHEGTSDNQIPVSRNKAPEQAGTGVSTPVANVNNHTVGSLMQLHQEMDRLFDDLWSSFGMPSRTLPSLSVSNFRDRFFGDSMLGDYRAELDISGNEKSYEVSVNVPGMSEDDINIELNGNVLTVRGQKEEKNETNDKQYYRVERRAGSFQRTLSLPEDTEPDGISATMKNGLLVIDIPRKSLPKADVKKIAIRN